MNDPIAPPTRPLNYERHDPNTPPRRWSIPALIGLPLGICGPAAAIGLAAELQTGFCLLLIPMSIIAALVCSWIGCGDTCRAVAPKRGYAFAVDGLVINAILTFLVLIPALIAVLHGK